MQYRITLTTDAYAHSPTVYKTNNYNVKLTYFKEAQSAESSIDMRWRSGWINFQPGYKVTLKKFQIFHEGTAGTLSVKFSSLDGTTDTFSINLNDYPTDYTEYFTNGALTGEMFRIEISNSDLNPLMVKKIIVVYDVEPLQ